MEQNKTYIIILVVTLVTAAVIAAALYLFSPPEEDLMAAGIVEQGDSFDPYLYMRSPGNSDGTSNPDSDSELPGEYPADGESGEPGENDSDNPLIFRQTQVYGQTEDGKQANDSTSSSSGDNANTQDSSPAELAVRSASSASSANATSPAEAQADGTHSTQATQAAAGTAGTAGNASSSNSDRAQQVSASSAAADSEPREYSEYWIQVIASTSLDSVEQVRTDILSHGFGGRISTLEKDDDLFYRLRYGPFEVKEEAEKFLKWIQHLEKYSQSFISLEQHSRS